LIKHFHIVMWILPYHPSVWFVALQPVLTLGNLVITSDSLHLVFV